ncbi:MAG: hypothetical protein KC420_04790 [Myxococcales bacterium]|nr:hypothetical protein [Myxococcales bacterium]MCB9565646.1 hypothetical protein [Myxococcales bacterium]MCB9703198.1 hypothetical protein [Myxococcales bacterium]
MRRPRTSALAALALAPALALGAGCHITGPTSIKTGRDNYNVAIQQTNNEQLLLNLVRLRYRDTPLFLEVSSVTTNFTFEVGSGAGGTINPSAGSTGTVSGSVGYTEKPTVSYVPLQGQRFVTQLLSPLDPRVILLMYHSGWAIDRILRICVQRLGPLDNASRASGPTPDSPPDHAGFFEATTILRNLWLEGAVELGYLEDDHGGALVLQIDDAKAGDPAVARLSQLLGLPEARLTVVLSDREPGGVTLVPRSLMAALFYLSQGVEVPVRDRREGRVTVTRDTDGKDFLWSKITGGLMRVHHQRTEPSDAYVAVRYRGRWFYIDDGDLDSKSTFALVSQLFELQSGEIKASGPMLTIPVGS